MTTTSLTPYVASNFDRAPKADVPHAKDGSHNPYSAPTAPNVDDPGRRGYVEQLRFVVQEWRNRELSPTESWKRKKCLILFALALFLTGLGVLIASLRKIEDTKYGVEYNVHKKQLDDAAKSGGLFLGPPGYEFIKFPKTFQTVKLNNRTCLSQDGLHVVFDVTFDYQMMEANILPAIVKYRNFEKWADVVEAAGLSAIHHSCANYVISDFQKKRRDIQTDMEDNVRIKLEGDPEDALKEGVYAKAISLQLQNVELPTEYNEAVREKQSAEEDIELAKNERKQELTKAETELKRSKEESQKIKDTAKNEAEVLLTEARLKAEETIFAFEKEAEIIVEVKSSLNLTTEGILAYLYNSLLSEVETLKITSGEPAKLSRSDEL